MKRLTILMALALLAGCSYNPGRTSEPVEVSGQLTHNGRPVSDVVLNLQPTGAGTQATLPVKNGAFKGSVTPGKYTYYVSPGSRPAAFETVPQKYHAGAMDRQVQIDGGELKLTID